MLKTNKRPIWGPLYCVCSVGLWNWELLFNLSRFRSLFSPSLCSKFKPEGEEGGRREEGEEEEYRERGESLDQLSNFPSTFSSAQRRARGPRWLHSARATIKLQIGQKWSDSGSCSWPRCYGNAAALSKEVSRQRLIDKAADQYLATWINNTALRELFTAE